MYARAYVRTIWTLRSCLKYSVVLPFCTSILLPPKENDLSCLYGLWHILKQDKEWMIVSLISSSCIRQWSKLTQLDFTQKRSSLSNYNRRDKVNETETGFKETHLLKHICKMVVYPAHLHRQTGRFTVWAPSKQNSGLVNFSRELRFLFVQISSTYRKTAARRPETVIKDGFEEIDLEFPSGTIRPENRTTFIYMFQSVAPGNFPLERPKNSCSFYFPSAFFGNFWKR